MAQVAWADVIVLTQADLADAECLSRLETQLAQLAPDTPRLNALHGKLDPELLLGRAMPGFRRVPAGVELPEHDFHSVSLRLESPVAWSRLAATLEAVQAQWGSRLLRVKGVVYVPDEPRPLLVQMAAGRLHPPIALAPRDSDDGLGRLVFISVGGIDGLAEQVMAALLDITRSGL